MDDAPDPYEQVAAEIDAGQIDKPLWVRSFAEASGDDAKTKASYIRYRVQKVRAIHQQAVLEAKRQEQHRAEQAQREAAAERREKSARAARQEEERREAERRARAEYWTPRRILIAWAWGLGVLLAVFWLAASGANQSSTFPRPTGTPAASPGLVIAPSSTPVSTASTPTSPPTPTPYGVYRTALEKSVRAYLKLHEAADPVATIDCFEYPLQVGTNPDGHFLTVTRSEMHDRLHASRARIGVCYYTLIGQIMPVPATNDNAGSWEVSFKVRVQQQTSPYAAVTRDYEMIMRPIVDRGELRFNITSIRETTER